ncbi:hypothetical protein D3C73_932920 [compost metagenome]
MLAVMGNTYIAVHHTSEYFQIFMDNADPLESHVASHKTISSQAAGHIPIFIASQIVMHRYSIYMRWKTRDKSTKLLSIFGQHNVICIQP